MKNKTLKNLIFLGIILVAFVVSFNYTNAGYYDYGYRPSMTNTNQPVVPIINSYSTQEQFNYGQQLPYSYVQPTVKYIEQPVSSPQVQYIPKTTTTTSTKTNTITKNSNTTKTGEYVNYDTVNYDNGVNYDNSDRLNDDNGLTALSLRGSDGFMPRSIFGWILFILLIFAIIVVARILYKKVTNKDSVDH